MKDYLNFQPEDFAEDDFFIHWVKFNSITAETFWQNWLETYPFKRNEVEIARQLVLITQNLPEPEISDSEINTLKESIFDRIETIENKKNGIWALIPKWAAAAAVTGLLFLAGLYWFNHKPQPNIPYNNLVTQAAEKYDLVEVKNTKKATRLVTLPDGSSVILKKGSKLAYPNHFDKNTREVYLTGEAFFEIVKDPEKPFYVYANEIVTKVLGTSFNVRAYQEDKEISVTVKTGKVSVYRSESINAKKYAENKALKGLILTPNQQAIFVKENTNIVKKNIAPEVIPVQPEIEQMTFEYQEIPVSDIFSQLEKAYNIRIVYDSTVIGKCPITASLMGEPLYEKLKLICKAVGVQYEIVNGEVVITGKGCE